MNSFYRILCLTSLMAAVASQTWSEAVCYDRLRIAGSEYWISCDHDNTYECNGGKNCCCESGFEANADGYCVACDGKSIEYVAPDGCACVPTVDPNYGLIDSCTTDTEYFAWCYVEGQCEKKPSSELNGKYYTQCIIVTPSTTQAPIPTQLPTVDSPIPTQLPTADSLFNFGYEHVYQGCVGGHNIVLYHEKSVHECAQLCNQHEECVAFEYGVNHGGVDDTYQPRDCQLQDSSNYVLHGKYYNLDIYIKKPAASKVIDYHDCDIVNSVTSGTSDSKQLWNTECPSNTAVVSVETKTVETDFSWTITRMKCCGLVDKITDTQDCDRIPENLLDRLAGGGSSSVEDQWGAQCGPDAIMIGIWDNDDSGDFDDIDAAKCCALDTLYTSGKKIDNDDCAVVNLSANSKFDCPHDYALVGLYDERETEFRYVRKMKCCRVLESILPTVSPTQMPTTNNPSECPTASPSTSIPSMSPTTDNPTLYPSQNPTTEQPTNLPSRSPSTEEPSVSPSLRPTFSAPTYYPSKNPTKNPTTETPTVSPSADPTYHPSTSPSKNPTTETPTVSPTISPSAGPTYHPSTSPSKNPTTETPTVSPTVSPSADPTYHPSTSPSKNPTTETPTVSPTISPSAGPTYHPSTSPSKNPTTETPTVSPTISPSAGPTYHPSTSPSKNPTTETPTVSPTISPSTDQPTKVPSISPTTEEPSAFPTTEDPSLFPTMSPSTDSPTKSPSRNPTTDDPTAFPSAAPTLAPTICEPTCRSHSDQMVNILGRLLDFNSDLLEKFDQLQPSNDPLKNVLNEMILDFNRLKDQMREHDRIPFISSAN